MLDIPLILMLFLVTVLMPGPSYAEGRRGYLAVMPLQGSASLPKDVKSNLNLLCEGIRGVAVTETSYKVMTSENIFSILHDKHINPNKCAGAQCEVDYGRALGADKLVVGTISYIEGIYYLDFSLYDVATALETTNSRRECKRCDFDKLNKLVESMSLELFGVTGESGQQEVKSATPAPAPVAQAPTAATISQTPSTSSRSGSTRQSWHLLRHELHKFGL